MSYAIAVNSGVWVKSPMTTYMKLLAQGSKRHLMKADQLQQETTLCGCVVTHVLAWRRISALEGDECEKCAALTFWASAPPRVSGKANP